MTHYMKHSLLSTRRVISSIITRNFFVTRNKQCAFHDNSRQLLIRVVLSVSYLLVSYFVMNFLRRIFSVCHSFQSMCQSGRMKGFERCFKVEDQGTWRRQKLDAAILRPLAKRIQIKLYKVHLGKEKPVMGNIEPPLAIAKPAEGLNKPCQGSKRQKIFRR